MILDSSDKLFLYLAKKYKYKDTVDICSYGMYLGISKEKDWYPKFPNIARSFIDKVCKQKLRVVIGEPYYMECTKDCSHCKEKFNITLKRHLDTARMLGLDIKFSPTCHLKYYRVGSTVIVGGINLGDSKNFDCCMVLNKSDGSKMKKIFNDIWNKSERIPNIR